QSQYPADKLNANVLLYRATLAMRSGDAAAAERWYRESLARYSDLPTADECRYGLATALGAEKKTDAADEILHQLTERSDSAWSERAALQLAAHELAVGKAQSALEMYETALNRFPDSPRRLQAQFGQARALVELGRYADAQNILRPLASQKESAAEARDLLTH